MTVSALTLPPVARISDTVGEVRDELYALQERFLRDYLMPYSVPGPVFESPSTAPLVASAAEMLDIKAYSLLAHAALEQGFEDLCEYAVRSAVRQFLDYRTFTRPLLMTVAYWGQQLAADTSKTSVAFMPSVREKEFLGKASRVYTESVIQRNHGMSCQYLLKILSPVGVSENPTVDELNSINQLKIIRGDFAHRFQARIAADPVAVQRHVRFCFTYFFRIAQEIAQMINDPIPI